MGDSTKYAIKVHHDVNVRYDENMRYELMTSHVRDSERGFVFCNCLVTASYDVGFSDTNFGFDWYGTEEDAMIRVSLPYLPVKCDGTQSAEDVASKGHVLRFYSY